MILETLVLPARTKVIKTSSSEFHPLSKLDNYKLVETFGGLQQWSRFDGPKADGTKNEIFKNCSLNTTVEYYKVNNALWNLWE